ncbi:hypothetical protein BGX38DRAFT_541877 [Terfezia claveryi]|nr:hypothetical protein BGX38DRAFT_541877 [Terfezia claveryi]
MLGIFLFAFRESNDRLDRLLLMCFISFLFFDRIVESFCLLILTLSSILHLSLFLHYHFLVYSPTSPIAHPRSPNIWCSYFLCPIHLLHSLPRNHSLRRSMKSILNRETKHSLKFPYIIFPLLSSSTLISLSPIFTTWVLYLVIFLVAFLVHFTSSLKE